MLYIYAKGLRKQDYNGFLFNDGDVDAFKKTMIYVYGNRSKLIDYGKAESETVKVFKRHRYKQNIQEFYSDLLKNLV